MLEDDDFMNVVKENGLEVRVNSYGYEDKR